MCALYTLFMRFPFVDYDPEEDRKACKEAEREEAKRRRLEIKQEEKARVKEEKEKIKAHKSHLRKRRDMLKKSKRKKRGELKKLSFTEVLIYAVYFTDG